MKENLSTKIFSLLLSFPAIRGHILWCTIWERRACLTHTHQLFHLLLYTDPHCSHFSGPWSLHSSLIEFKGTLLCPRQLKRMEHGAISLLTSEFHSLYIETSTLIKYHQFLESIITKMHVGGMRNLYKYMLNMIVWGVLEKKNPSFMQRWVQ